MSLKLRLFVKSKIAKNNRTKISRRIAAVVAVVVVCGGIALLQLSLASTNKVVVEPETALISGNASKIIDSTASNEGLVQFGTNVTQTTFKHPGVLIDKGQLDYVKTKVAAGQQPWKLEYDRMKSNGYASTAWVSKPVSVLKCPSNSTKAASYGYESAGCTESVNDSTAAYTQALLWHYTGDVAYATSAKNILKSWASTMTTIAFDQPRYPDNNAQVYNNGLLYGGWSGAHFVKAAEILRHSSNSGWTTQDSTQMQNFFTNVYYPLMKDGWTSGANTTAVMHEAALSIAIFNDSKQQYDYVLPQVKHTIKQIVYSSSDGIQPLYPQYGGKPTYIDTASELKSIWSNPSSYRAGLIQETCRDMGHAMMSMGSVANMVETLRIQGDTTYSTEQNRLVAAFELNSKYVTEYLDHVGGNFNRTVTTGWKPNTNWVCPSFASTAGGFAAATGWEVGYNLYGKRQNVLMPNTQQLIGRIRTMTSTNTRVANHIAWETLTHAK